MRVFKTTGEECGWDYCDDNEADFFDSSILLNQNFFDDVYARDMDGCTLIYTKQAFLYINSIKGIDTGNLIITIYDNYINFKVSVFVVIILIVFMTQIPLKSFCRSQAKDEYKKTSIIESLIPSEDGDNENYNPSSRE